MHFWPLLAIGYVLCEVDSTPAYIDPNTVTHETIHDNAKRLFALFNEHFSIEYPTPDDHREHMLSFARNLAHHNATHAEDIAHLDRLVAYRDEYAVYGLTSAFARDPTKPLGGFVADTGLPEYDLRLLKDRLRHRWNRVKDFVVHKTSVVYATLLSAPVPAARAGCLQMYMRNNPLPNLAKLPLSVDLREYELLGKVRNQKVCGCCWAMASAVVLEGMVRSTQSYFKTSADVDNTFKDPAFIASEQYIMNNSRSFINDFCEGGNYKITSLDYANGNLVETVESEDHFPLMFTHMETNPPKIDPIKTPKVTKMFMPYNTVTATSTCQASLIKILEHRQMKSPMTYLNVKEIKSFLARGIPVAAAMFTGGDGPLSSRDFSNYKEGIFNKPCTTLGLDHQIVFAGYGFYQGVEVWVMRNSWGEDWGVDGYFYTPIGNNVLCSEMYAYTDIPKYFPLNNADKDKLYVERVPTPATTYWRSKMKRGDGKALDSDPSKPQRAGDGPDNASYRPMGRILPISSTAVEYSSKSSGMSATKIVIIVAAIIGGAGVAGLITKFACCKR